MGGRSAPTGSDTGPSAKARALLRFYAELNDFLPSNDRQRDLSVDFESPCPVRHLVETCGVPHTEIEIILLNGRSVDLDTPVHDGDRISVYPVCESIDVRGLLRLRDYPLRVNRFSADAHLGRLARYLRLLGFDTTFENAIADAELVARARLEKRIVLTRDVRLLMRRDVTHGCHVRPEAPLEQLNFVVERLDLRGSIRPFTRCMACNGIIEPVAKRAVAHVLLPATLANFEEFWRCSDCHQVYWKGSHYDRLKVLVDEFSPPSCHGDADS